MAEKPSGFQVWKRAAIAMIDALPDHGATIIVLTMEIGGVLKRRIRELRSPKLARRCRMISVHRWGQLDKLNGLRGLVIIDLSVMQHADQSLWIEIDEMVRAARLVPPAASGRDADART